MTAYKQTAVVAIAAIIGSSTALLGDNGKADNGKMADMQKNSIQDKKLDYLEKLFNGIAELDDENIGDAKEDNKGSKTVITLKDGRKIVTDKTMSLVLLSFEKERELRKKRLKEIQERKKKAQQEKERKRQQQAQYQPTMPHNPKRFPTLEEQMRAFQNGRALPDIGGATVENGNPNSKLGGKDLLRSAVPADLSPYYGTICRKNKCYLLGEHGVYRVGQKLNGKKITKITESYVEFDGKEKEWFTR